MVPESSSSDRETVAFGQQLERGWCSAALCFLAQDTTNIWRIGLGDLKLGSQHTFKIWRRARVGSTALKPLGVLEWKVPGFFSEQEMGVCYGLFMGLLWRFLDGFHWLQLVGDIHQRWLRSPFLGREDGTNGTNTKHGMHMECTWNAHGRYGSVCVLVCLMRFYEYFMVRCSQRWQQEWCQW